MNVYEYAMKVEKEGEAYYRELAAMSPNKGLKKIFSMLADEEVKHYNVFKNMLKKSDIPVDRLALETDTKIIFQTLREEKDSLDLTSNQIQFYKDAIKREEDAHDFYFDKAKELESLEEKEIFLLIAIEEEKHKEVLQNIVSFIEEPANWVTAAEF